MSGSEWKRSCIRDNFCQVLELDDGVAERWSAENISVLGLLFLLKLKNMLLFKTEINSEIKLALVGDIDNNAVDQNQYAVKKNKETNP